MKNHPRHWPLEPLTIESLSHEGRGVARHQEKATFVWGALPGEVATVRFMGSHRRYLEGRAEAISQPHVDRVLPVCPHFGTCGGCVLQHLAHPAQIQHKEKVLLEQLIHFGRVKPRQVLPPLWADSWHYRTKARLGAKYVPQKERLLLGFRESYSSKITDIKQCPILAGKVSALLPAWQACLAGLEAFAHVPQLEVAVSGEITAFVLRHMIPLSEADQATLKTFAQKHQIWLYLQPAGPESVYKVYPEEGSDRLSYTLADYELKYFFHPLDFTQINPAVNAKMVTQALACLEVQAGDRVLDLFCGLGNFSLPLAQRAQLVVGVEGDRAMVLKAQENAQHNQLSNVAFYETNLYEPEHVSRQDWSRGVYDKVLLDPPRSGAEPLIPWLSTSAARKMVYISCNPATLARDLGLLVNQWGWSLEAVGMIDMFPHTKHIEAMAVLSRRKGA